MPLTHYILQNLHIFRCIIIGEGGLIIGGCADVIFTPVTIPPKRCFKFLIGEEVFTKDGRPYIVIGIMDSGGVTIFYELQYGSYIIELPESAIFSKSEIIECRREEIKDIQDLIDSISSIPPAPNPLPGIIKIPSDHSVKLPDLSAIQSNIDRLSSIVPQPDPSPGKIKIKMVPDKNQIRLAKVEGVLKKSQEEIDRLRKLLEGGN
jgi:hypothetical protein